MPAGERGGAGIVLWAAVGVSSERGESMGRIYCITFNLQLHIYNAMLHVKLSG